MTFDYWKTKSVLLALIVLGLGACGGSNENASPGSIVVETPGGGGNGGGGNGGGGNGGGGNGGGGTGTPVASVIPDALSNVIFDSGTTTSAAFGNRPIYTIDVSQLDDGRLDPSGLLLGNDYAFQIDGGALRISAQAAASGAVSTSQLPECVLELAPGAVMYGSGTTDFLVIEQDCAILADGTVEQPITFTAAEDIAGTVEPNDRALWGGVVINGRAPINDCPQGIQGGTAECTKEGEANSGLFGGDDPNDNSGILRYVTVRYAGSNVDPENQLNGIAFQGVGDETIIEYVQVHNNLDDGIEFFGGTANAKYIVLTGNADDSLDWTDGWAGRIQYIYIEQTDSADNGIEADNREGNEGAEPQSLPTIANMSIYGNAAENGVLLRRGTGLNLWNSYLSGSASCLIVDGSSRDLLGTDIQFSGVSLDCESAIANDDDAAVESYLASALEVSLDGGAVEPVPPTDPFFESTEFVGAFGTTNWAQGWTVPGSVSFPGLPDFGCPAGTADAGESIDGTRVCDLEGTITEDLVLTANNLYQLNGKVTIGGDNADSAVLTIQAGTTVFGGTEFDFLVVSRGSQIVANGTRTAPITMTARADVEGTANLDTDRGLWGGLVINGNAPINDCPQGIAGGTEQCTKEGEANSGLFGGANPADSSGVLRYLVVKFAGSNVDPENQLNGIAFQGVGSETVIEYIQVHNNLDDGVEFFGGTANARYVVLTGNADDSLDWTDGWVGSIQYLVIQQADDAADNGIEADSREGNETATPRSLPRIANMTINGSGTERGILLRRGTGLELYNAVVAGNDVCLQVEGDSLSQLGTGIVFDGVSFDCTTLIGDGNADVQNLLDNSNVSQTGEAVPPADLSGDAFFDDAPFIGAIQDEENDWTRDWTVAMPDAGTDFPCPAGTTTVDDIGGRETCSLSGTYSGDLVLTRDNYYVLDGKVTIGGDNTDVGTLTINSGTTIIGDDPEDFLVISRGSRILANGTQFSPVTFTALADVEGSADQVNDRGLWGGLVINGNAPINDCPEGVEGGTAGCTKEGEANSGLFGGADPDDDSGVLRYVVVKFAGSNVDPENQLNGIAFQGTGAGTQVEYIQVHNNLDDGVEFFGGTTSAKFVVLTGNADDSLDWTDGWLGNLQFVHIVQTAGISADHGIEADNREGDELATPVAEPTIANMTIQGIAGERGILLRRGTGLNLYNSKVSGSAACLDVQGASVDLLGDGITFQGVSLGCEAAIDPGSAEPAAIQSFLDGSPNVTTDGSDPAPVAVPGGGFFDQIDVIGSDFESWGTGWTVNVE